MGHILWVMGDRVSGSSRLLDAFAITYHPSPLTHVRLTTWNPGTQIICPAARWVIPSPRLLYFGATIDATLTESQSIRVSP